MALVTLALGSNLGNRAENLRQARQALASDFQIQVCSRVYQTEPAYLADQPRYYNQVCQAITALPPLDTLRRLKAIETRLGRVPSVRFGPRLIDLDLLFYDDDLLESPELILPHPRIEERPFVLVPLAEVAPNLVHPRLGVTVAELLRRLGDTRSAIWPADEAATPAPSLTIGKTTFEWGQQTYIMGIINVTPDSFSGDGTLRVPEAAGVARAVAQGVAQVAAGAHLLDVGGESTRPGSQPVPLADELRRVLPVMAGLSAAVSVPISIDTYKAETARQALAAGATIINDVWGLRMDPAMGMVAAESGAALILMHNRSRPKDAAQSAHLGGRYVGVEYADLMADIARELGQSVQMALQAGVAAGRIIVDPGIGFGKTVEQNLELVDRLAELRALGYPLLVGPSRKSFVGYTLNLPPEQRLEGTAAAVTLSIDRGADIVRVHDVEAMARVARIADAMTRRGRRAGG
jgi:dihydropteroate synthase/2-amino-4-hydroxy-6-hydroxymethyldihydropteridine diphosphokinase